MNILIKLLIALALIAGIFFTGMDYGGKRERVKYQREIIEAGKEDVDVEVRQSKIRANRDNYNLSERLQSGTF